MDAKNSKKKLLLIKASDPTYSEILAAQTRLKKQLTKSVNLAMRKFRIVVPGGAVYLAVEDETPLNFAKPPHTMIHLPKWRVKVAYHTVGDL